MSGKFRLFKCFSIFSLFLGSASGLADNVSIANFDGNPRFVITQQEFDRAQNAAGEGGRIFFARGSYRINRPLNVTKRGVRIVGQSRSNTEIINTQTKSQAVFIVGADNVLFERLTIRGERHVSTIDPLHVKGGSRVRRGTEYGIFVSGQRNNLNVSRVNFKKVNVGIHYQTGRVPNGMVVDNCRFSTARGMIILNDNARNPAGSLSTPFMILDSRFVIDPGQITPYRGLVFDFGNSSEGMPVNMRGSLIQGNNIMRLGGWNIGVNRSMNLTIRDNILGGGGRGENERFVHCIHFEDRSRNILVEENTCRQELRNDENRILLSRSFIWGGGNNGLPEITVINNTFIGNVESGIAGALGNWRVNDNDFNVVNSNARFVINNFSSPNRVREFRGNRLNGGSIPSSKVKLGR